MFDGSLRGRAETHAESAIFEETLHPFGCVIEIRIGPLLALAIRAVTAFERDDARADRRAIGRVEKFCGGRPIGRDDRFS